MAAESTLARDDDLSSQPHLFPVVRVEAHAPRIDVAARIGECITGFLSHPDWIVAYLDRADPAAPLLDVPDPAPLYAALPAQERSAIERDAQRFEQLVLHRLAAPLGIVTRQELTCLQTDQDGLRAGTVVLVRESDVVTEQYAFPCIRVDHRNGEHTVAVPPQTAVGSTGVHAQAGGLQVGQQLVGAGMAVTPFLPPPYGVAATGALAFVNLMLGLVQDGEPKGPSPLQAAVESLKTYEEDIALSQLAGEISGPAGEYANMVASQTQSIDSLSSIDGGIEYIRGMLVKPWTPDVVKANAKLFEMLKRSGTSNFDRTLSLLVSGITTQLLMYHGQVAIGATDASIQFRHKQVDAYGEATSTWTMVAHTAALDIGASHSGDWTGDEITAAMDRSTSYLPKIEGWMAKAKNDRMAQISGLTRFQHSELVDKGQGYGSFTYYGWTFTDGGVDGDHGYKANCVLDTAPDSGCGKWTEHKDVAQRHLASYRLQVAKSVDDAFAPHRQVMASWTTYVAALLALLPPAVPPTPRVSPPPAGGAPSPSGDWKAGDQVRYALMAKGTRGPSPASDWSPPMTIGAEVGAVVAGITLVGGADTLVVLRQFRQSGATEWGETQQVVALVDPFPSSYTDTDIGGDPW